MKDFYFSFSAPAAGDAGLAFFSCDSLILDDGVGSLAPEPVVPGLAFVPREGMPLVFPVSLAVDGSVGDGAVALVPPPD
jgi:hypothetical protein